VSSRAWRWLVWILYAAAWTRALLMPNPVQPGEDSPPQLIPELFFFSKSVHLCAYALFAMLSGWVRAPVRGRWLLLLLMMGHAVGTEFLQNYVETRHPSARDVLLDLVGIGLGIALTWDLWYEPRIE
jgi:VanZ family protein